jgi:hypothetical protein
MFESVSGGCDDEGMIGEDQEDAADAAAIDGMLAAMARNLGADDPHTEQQRRADLFADLLLGRLAFDDNIDPNTGELLGTQLQRIDADGQPIGESVDALTHQPIGRPPKLIRRPRKVRIAVVVPLSSLLGNTDAPAELSDRSGFIPGEMLRQHIADAIGNDRRTEILFTRLLTADGGRLLDTTELGRHASTRLAEAIKSRAGTCRFPTCTVPADRCDLDHHQPHPHWPTPATNEDPFCRRHHRGKNLRLARLHQRRTRCRLDAARRRTLPMPRRTATYRHGGLRKSALALTMISGTGDPGA